MSSGRPEDWENTRKQLMNPNPVSNNRTWLNHGVNTQGGKIDLLVLQGEYTIEEIASKIPEAKDPIKRVKDHLEHLQEGDSRDKVHGTEPHKLHIVCNPNKPVMFLSESSGNYKYTDIPVSNNHYLPTEEDFKTASRLAPLGERVSIDAILDQIEINVTKEGHSLKPNWRMITEENIKIWIKK